MADDLGNASARAVDSHNDVSTLRLYALRFLYLGNFVGLASSVWPALISPAQPIEPVTGVAFAFWAALSTLSALGLRYPLKMLPVLFMQLFYKSVWLLAVALPAWASGQWSSGVAELFNVMAIGAVVDLLIIPWPYVFANYVRKRGDAWTFVRRRPKPTMAPPVRGQ